MTVLNPLISIVVLNWNGKSIFPSCLESLEKTEYKPYEVLFVDNGSTDGSASFARQFQGVRIIDNKVNLGYAAGNNRAFVFINPQSKYVCFLNNDVVVTPGWLNNAISYLDKYPEIGVIACRNMDYANRDVIDGLYHYIQRFFSLGRFGRGLPYSDAPFSNEPGYVISALGASAIYRSELFYKLGGFDETFYAYFEDSDLCMRINNSGYRCFYVPDAVVYHQDQASFGKKSPSSVYYSFRNEWFFFKKNFPVGFLSRHLGGMWLENLRTLKSCLAGDNNLKIFLKARRDSLMMLKRYHFESYEPFNTCFVKDLIKKTKIPLSNRL
jgi:GT2 family glycosyltransferase